MVVMAMYVDDILLTDDVCAIDDAKAFCHEGLGITQILSKELPSVVRV